MRLQATSSNESPPTRERGPGEGDRQGRDRGRGRRPPVPIWQQIDAGGNERVAPGYHVEHVPLTLEPGDGQAPPLVVATISGTRSSSRYSGSPPATRSAPTGAPSSRRWSRSPRAAATSLSARAVAIRRFRLAQPASSGSAWVECTSWTSRATWGSTSATALSLRDSADPAAMWEGSAGWTTTTTAGSTSTRQLPFHRRRRRPAGRSAAPPAQRPLRNGEGTFSDVSRAQAPTSSSGERLRRRRLRRRRAHRPLCHYRAGRRAHLWNEGGGEIRRRRARQESTPMAGTLRPPSATSTPTGAGPVRRGIRGLERPGPGGGRQRFPADLRGVRDRLYLNEGPDANGCHA